MAWAGARVTVKTPAGLTVAVPSSVPLASVTRTEAPASPRPLIALPSAATTVVTGASGAVVSAATSEVETEV